MDIPCSHTDTGCHWTGIPCTRTDTLTFSPKQEMARMHRAGAVVSATDLQLPGPQFDPRCGSSMHTFCLLFFNIHNTMESNPQPPQNGSMPPGNPGSSPALIGTKTYHGV